MDDYKIIEGHPDYAVTKDGRVISFKNGKVRELSKNNNRGYSMVYLTENSKTKGFSVHRLVASAFIPNPENKPTVNHIDGNKSNNYFTNL